MFTDPAVKLRGKLVVRFEMNSIHVTMRHLNDDYVCLTEGCGDATSSIKLTETILSNEAGEKL
jgi:hypothetical protein